MDASRVGPGAKEATMTQSHSLQSLHGMMVFLGGAANGLEDLLGRGAPGITYRAGRSRGLKQAVSRSEPDDLERALEAVWEEMCVIGMRWAFEPYHRTGEPKIVVGDDGVTRLHLVFRNCLVRNTLFRYGYPQRLSLCLMNHGLFCGLLERIHGRRSNLEILHAGENACLKLLTVEPKK